MTESSAQPPEARPTLRQIVAVFLSFANATFGGGSATIAVLHRQIVQRRRWLSQEDFNQLFGLCRVTPGTNLLAFCTGTGWKVRRWPGALLALLAASLPCSAIVVVVTWTYEVWQRNAFVTAALRGALAGAVAVMIYTAWHLARPLLSRASLARAGVIIAGALLSSSFSIAPFRVLLLAGVLGALWIPARSGS